MLHAYATCLFVAKIAVFFFLSKFLRLEIKCSAQFPLEIKKSARQTWLIEI